MEVFMWYRGGERVWKFAGRVEQMTINGDEVINVANITDKTLYSSPYLVATDRNYTKHYFAGSERVCSKIGGGFGSDPISPTGAKLKWSGPIPVQWRGGEFSRFHEFDRF